MVGPETQQGLLQGGMQFDQFSAVVILGSLPIVKRDFFLHVFHSVFSVMLFFKQGCFLQLQSHALKNDQVSIQLPQDVFGACKAIGIKPKKHWQILQREYSWSGLTFAAVFCVLHTATSSRF